ncbi:MAG: DUF1513 domain-containing protein [Bdellovibrionota bacterium]
MDFDALKRRDFLQLMSGALAGTGFVACAGPITKPSSSTSSYTDKGKVFLCLSNDDDRSIVRTFDWTSGEHHDVRSSLGLPHSVVQHRQDPSILNVFESLGSCVKLDLRSGREIKIDHKSSPEMFAGHGVLDSTGRLLFSTQGLSGTKRGIVTARDADSLQITRELPLESLHAHQVVHMPGERSIVAWGNMRGPNAASKGGVTFFDYASWNVVKRIDLDHPILHLIPISSTEVVALSFIPRSESLEAGVKSSKSSRENLLASMPSKSAAPTPLYRVSSTGSARTFWDEKNRHDFVYNFGLASVKPGERYLTGHTGSNKVFLWKDFAVEKSFDVDRPNNIAVSADSREFMVGTKGGIDIFSLETFERLRQIRTERPVVAISSYQNAPGR